MHENAPPKASNLSQNLRYVLFVAVLYLTVHIFYNFVIIPLRAQPEQSNPPITVGGRNSYPVSAEALRVAISHFTARDKKAMSDLRGCFSSFLSVNTVLTYNEMTICEFSADTDYPSKRTFASLRDLNLKTLRQEQIRAAGLGERTL